MDSDMASAVSPGIEFLLERLKQAELARQEGRYLPTEFHLIGRYTLGSNKLPVGCRLFVYSDLQSEPERMSYPTIPEMCRSLCESLADDSKQGA